MNDFLNEESAKSLVERPRPSTTDEATKKRAIDRWENEGGEIPLPSKPLSAVARADG
jgi:hypothetical protein